MVLNSTSIGLSSNARTVFSIYYIFLTITSLLFNLLLILTIASKRKLLTVTNIFIINLAIGDIITTLILPFDIDIFIRGFFSYGEIVCGIREVGFMLSLPSSITCLFLLTIERFVSIVFPFKRIRYIRKSSAIVGICVAWSYNLLMALIPTMLSKDPVVVINGKCFMNFPLEYIYFQLAVNFIAPVLIISLMNFILFRVASKHASEMKKRSLIGSSRKVRPSMITLGANLKAAKTILLLVAIFLICWMTFIILGITNTMCHACHPRYVTYLGNAINYSSITLNPILYGLRNSEIRREIIRKSKEVVNLYCRCYKDDGLFEKTPSTQFETSFSYADFEIKRRRDRIRSPLMFETET